MLLSEIFDQLTYGELSQTVLGGKAGGVIAQESYPAVISHINLALTELYKRFPIKVREIEIQQYAAIGIYYLDSKYSSITGTATTKYLKDSATFPFKDDVLKITDIYDKDGVALSFNDVNSVTSITTRDYNSFSVPNPLDTVALTVEYRADHDMIDSTEIDPTTVDVEIPRSLLEPLLNYVGFRAYAANPPIDGVDRSGQYLQKFEASVQRVTYLDLVNELERSNQKIWDNGWP